MGARVGSRAAHDAWCRGFDSYQRQFHSRRGLAPRSQTAASAGWAGLEGEERVGGGGGAEGSISWVKVAGPVVRASGRGPGGWGPTGVCGESRGALDRGDGAGRVGGGRRWRWRREAPLSRGIRASRIEPTRPGPARPGARAGWMAGRGEWRGFAGEAERATGGSSSRAMHHPRRGPPIPAPSLRPEAHARPCLCDFGGCF